MTEPVTSAEILASTIARIEHLEDEMAVLRDDRKEIYTEAKSKGFCTETIKAIVKLRKLDPHTRAERDAILEIYKAALGMLDGDSLSDNARKRLAEKEPRRARDDRQSDIEDFTSPEEEEDTAPVEDLDASVTEQDARELGQGAAKAGHPITANPFKAGDPRRAAWDEAWCMTSGSDGMDVPEAWRRSKPKKAGNDNAGDEEKAA